MGARRDRLNVSKLARRSRREWMNSTPCGYLTADFCCRNGEVGFDTVVPNKWNIEHMVNRSERALGGKMEADLKTADWHLQYSKSQVLKIYAWRDG